jgi:hypothetical protein
LKGINEKLSNGEKSKGLGQLTNLLKTEAPHIHARAEASGVNIEAALKKVARSIPGFLEEANDGSGRRKGMIDRLDQRSVVDTSAD